MAEVVGYGAIRASEQLVKLTKVVVILKLQTHRDMPYYVFTAFLTK